MRHGHKFSGHYFPYPSSEQPLGLVSTTQDNPPMLNWIFIDVHTHELRYGGQKDTLGHITGPFGWSSDDERTLTLQANDDNFVAIREEQGLWAVRWDPDDKLRGGVESYQCKGIKLTRVLSLGVENRYVESE